MIGIRKRIDDALDLELVRMETIANQHRGEVVADAYRSANIEVKRVVELATDEIKEIRKVTGLQNDAGALRHAAREYLRMRKMQELKLIAGKVDFEVAEDES